MRKISWKTEFRNILVFMALAAVPGFFFDILPWTLLLVAVGYLGWFIRQLWQVQEWLKDGANSYPPEAHGLFGAVLDDLYRQQRIGRAERQQLEADLKYLEDSYTSLLDAAVMLNEDGAIRWFNKAAVDYLGLRYPDDTGLLLITLLRNPDFIRYFESGNYHEYLQIPSPHVEGMYLQIHITCFGEGSRIVLARDITETNRLQQMRKEFVANVSHELRTPLTVINGYLETLSDHADADEIMRRRAIEQMLIQSHRMENLIKDLMALSRLEVSSTIAEHTAIALRPMLEIIREDVLAAVNKKCEIAIECDDNLLLEGNPSQLHSAFANLVTNAAKYTADNSQVIVKWYKDESQAYLSVGDNGDGIEAHHIPRLTERFYRVDNSRSLETGGTGLGLAIVKHILLHHEAELKIESQLGVGSTFSCVFPLMRVHQQAHSA